MKASKTFFAIGIAAGIATFAAHVAGMETVQFVSAAVCLVSLMLAERKDTESDIEQN